MKSNTFIADATACVRAAQILSTEPHRSLPAAEQPVVHDLGNGLCIVYLVYTDDGLVYVKNRHLAEAGIERAALQGIGLANLIRRSDDKKLSFEEYGPVYGAHLDGIFEVSLILRDDLWDELIAHLAPNGFVIALPTSEVLGFCDAGSSIAVASLRTMAHSVAGGGDHVISQNLYMRRDGKWIVFDPPT
jgi:hypothetical protein